MIECHCAFNAHLSQATNDLSVCPQFCQSLALLFDYKAMLDNPSIECSVDYCIHPTIVGDPFVTGSSPGQGPASGGTLVRVDIANLPVFFVDELFAKITYDASSVFAKVVSLEQNDGSNLKAGNAHVTVAMPAVSANTEFATVAIFSKVFGMTKTVSFQFEYLPVIEGIAEIIEFFPRQIYRTQGLDLYVRVGNVHRLDHPYNASKMLVQVWQTL